MDDYTLRKRLEQRERLFMLFMMIIAYHAGDVEIFCRHVDLN